ncbi:MAG: fasciclin domain-containing protein [Pseudomonadota bacterium]
MFNRSLRSAFAALGVIALLAQQSVFAVHHEDGEHSEASNTIVDVAVGAGSFETLVTAIKAAGLVDVLSGDGPFTVLAPTDEAFAALPEGALASLLEDKDALTKVLTLHVVPGKAMAEDVVGLKSVTTVNGATLPVSTTDGVSVGGAQVVTTDIEASNGVIHVIDRVILPQG